MYKKNVVKASNILFESRLNKKKINLLPQNCQPQNIEEAYSIQEELTNLYLELNNNYIIGKKIGCTNKDAQIQININTPFSGNLFSKFSNINNCTLNSHDFTNPYFEPEFSFKINQDINISKAPYNYNEVKKFIKSIIPSIEIVDFRFNSELKDIGVYNLIASNGASEYWISGKKNITLEEINLDNHKVDVFINEKLIETGNSSNVLKNPINSLMWIINHLSEREEPILKDYIISTGTCTKAIKLKKGDKIKVDFNDIENLNFQYI